MKKQFFPKITADSDVQFGKAVIAGTRVPVDVIVGNIAGGMTVEEVMKEYDLEKEDVRAALHYASKIVSEQTIMLA